MCGDREKLKSITLEAAVATAVGNLGFDMKKYPPDAIVGMIKDYIDNYQPPDYEDPLYDSKQGFVGFEDVDPG